MPRCNAVTSDMKLICNHHTEQRYIFHLKIKCIEVTSAVVGGIQLTTIRVVQLFLKCYLVDHVTLHNYLSICESVKEMTQFSCVLVFLSFTFLPFSMSVIVLIVIVVFQTPFGLIRMTVVVVPFLYVGTLISKNFAALLEEHDIFVPEDDDDDD